MYTYTAGSTGLDAAMPLWVQEGGLDAWVARLKDPQQRARVIEEMRNPPAGEENLFRTAGSPDRVLFVGFKNPALKPLTGKTLADVMKMRGTSAEDTIIDLVIEDNSRVQTVYFLMSEDNVKLGLSQPWVSLGSDAEALAPEGVFLKSSTHPRAYGNFARLLGKYSRDEKLMPLEEAIRRITRLPATNWKLQDRGCLDVELLCRRRRLRSGDHRRQRDLRRAAAVRGRRRARVRQRRAGAPQRRAHRREAGTRRARAGLSALRGRRGPVTSLGRRSVTSRSRHPPQRTTPRHRLPYQVSRGARRASRKTLVIFRSTGHELTGPPVATDQRTCPVAASSEYSLPSADPTRYLPFADRWPG